MTNFARNFAAVTPRAQFMGKQGIDTDPIVYANARCVASYMEVAVINGLTVEAGWTIGSPGVTVAYAEIGVAVGDPVLNAAPTLTILGWASVAAEAATGNANVKKTLALSRAIRAGEHVWHVLACSATTPVTSRSMHGQMTFGDVVYRDSTRLSTSLNTPLLFTFNTAVVYTPPQSRIVLSA